MEKRFASRAGEKLDHALTTLNVDVTGKTCADLGSSTGGFVDCLLQRGAAKVYAVETGYGTLDWKLRNDPRVVVMERTNALHVILPEPVDLVTIDVSWTKQEKILPKAMELLNMNTPPFQGGERGGYETAVGIMTLVKPHYEAPKAWLTKGVLDPSRIDDVLQTVRATIASLGLTIAGETQSPIIGDKGGNVEYLFWLQ